ncbi:hypothetical protein DUI87_26993 [Hirundo rustica rustica]|uniref:Cadherin domain-containing protein n=1 Tax=Hirundo rustica rustica TaxID=333673 RepID=A0A3M0J7V1_HIRRU|nr:hypothetical protein DUI87_26993 [Hirundo rustica rustica]
MCGDSATCSVSFEALVHNPLNIFRVEVAIEDEKPGGKKQPELVLERALDREKQSSFELVLTAVDGGDPARSGTVQVRINVTDANDNPPVFSKSLYEARVAENLPVGSVVLQVRATDADAGSNGRVSYSFGNVPDTVKALFAVDSESGEVRTGGSPGFRGEE